MEKLRKILFKKDKDNEINDGAGIGGKRSPRAKVQSFYATKDQLHVEKIVVAQKTALGQVQVNTVILKDEDKEISEMESKSIIEINSKLNEKEKTTSGIVNREQLAQY